MGLIHQVMLVFFEVDGEGLGGKFFPRGLLNQVVPAKKATRTEDFSLEEFPNSLGVDIIYFIRSFSRKYLTADGVMDLRRE